MSDEAPTLAPPSDNLRERIELQADGEAVKELRDRVTDEVSRRFDVGFIRSSAVELERDDGTIAGTFAFEDDSFAADVDIPDADPIQVEFDSDEFSDPDIGTIIGNIARRTPRVSKEEAREVFFKSDQFAETRDDLRPEDDGLTEQKKRRRILEAARERLDEKESFDLDAVNTDVSIDEDGVRLIVQDPETGKTESSKLGDKDELLADDRTVDTARQAASSGDRRDDFVSELDSFAPGRDDEVAVDPVHDLTGDRSIDRRMIALAAGVIGLLLALTQL